MIRRPYRQGCRSAGLALSLSLSLHLLVLVLWSYHSRLTDLPPREPVPAAPFVKRLPLAQQWVTAEGKMVTAANHHIW